MKQKIEIELQLPAAAVAAHYAYHGQCVDITLQSGGEKVRSIAAPENMLDFDPAFLRVNKASARCERMMLAAAGEQVRRTIVHLAAQTVHSSIRQGALKRQSLREALGSDGICSLRETLIRSAYCEEPGDGDEVANGVILAVQKWKDWDGIAIAGWVHENVELAVDELGFLWGKIRALALRLKNTGFLPASTVREVCGDIVGVGLRGDREASVISRFYFDLAFSETPLFTAVESRIPHVLMSQNSPDTVIDLAAAPESEILECFTNRIDELSKGSDPGAAAARLLMALYNGNYLIAEDALCWVTFPVAPVSGNWIDISQPAQKLHPLPADYSMCARYTLHFLLSGFVWEVMSGGRRSEKEVFELIDRLWVPMIFQAFYVVAAPDFVAGASALNEAAATYARMVAIEGWFNPAEMRERLREIFHECYRILKNHREALTQLEEALRCGLVTGPEDVLELCAAAADGRFLENERFAILMRYQRERGLRYFQYANWKEKKGEEWSQLKGVSLAE